MMLIYYFRDYTSTIHRRHMRLTNEIRDSIINNIILAKFGKLKEAMRLSQFAFADAIYNSIDGIEKIVDVPEAWFVRVASFTARFNGNSAYQTMSLRRPLPYSVYNEGVRFTVEHELFQRNVQLKQEEHELQQAEKELTAELKKVLYSVNTFKRLIEIWPEATKWLPSESAVYLPANVDVVKLRNLLKPL